MTRGDINFYDPDEFATSATQTLWSFSMEPSHTVRYYVDEPPTIIYRVMERFFLGIHWHQPREPS